jgi:pimeloyl-ACP methyl ester carboxylesterase
VKGRSLVEREESLRVPDGTLLRYTLRESGAERLLVVSPGIFMDRANEEHIRLARVLAELADVVTLDVRGHGDSGGAFSFGVKEPADLAALAASLRPRYSRVGGLGFSFGGLHTVVAAARYRCFDAVALVGTPHRLFLLDHNFLTWGLLRSLPFTLRRRRRWTRLALWPGGRPPTPSRLVGLVAPVPLLLIHGSADWLVSPVHARRLFREAGDPRELVIVERGLHAENMLAADPDPLLRSLLDFFRRTL